MQALFQTEGGEPGNSQQPRQGKLNFISGLSSAGKSDEDFHPPLSFAGTYVFFPLIKVIKLYFCIFVSLFSIWKRCLRVDCSIHSV